MHDWRSLRQRDWRLPVEARAVAGARRGNLPVLDSHLKTSIADWLDLPDSWQLPAGYEYTTIGKTRSLLNLENRRDFLP